MMIWTDRQAESWIVRMQEGPVCGMKERLIDFVGRQMNSRGTHQLLSPFLPWCGVSVVAQKFFILSHEFKFAPSFSACAPFTHSIVRFT
mmetsp:Transcript_34832/g.68772  ORF Transcript_34832/g.68772 Transcript_34832/m.68772 type:complete len:89 (-) Transcript_34832:394-660(-)